MKILNKLSSTIKQIKERYHARRHIKNMQNKKAKAIKATVPSQSEQFVASRSPALQYFIDVFALAFILSVVLTIITRVWK